MNDDLIIRASMTSQYSDCSLRTVVSYYPNLFKNLGYEPRVLKPAISAAVGVGGHAGAAHSLTGMIESGSLAPESESVEVGIEAFTKETKDGCQTDKITPTKDRAHRQIQQITRAYNSVAYKFQPLAVEQRLYASVPSVPGFQISGRFDQLDIDKGKYRILDLKTGNSKASYLYQVGLYSLIAEANKVKLGISGIDLSGVIRVPRASDKAEQADPSIELYDLDKAKKAGLSMFKRIARDITELERTGEPMLSFAANPWSMFCSRKSCSAFGTTICSLWSEKEKEID